MISLPHMHRRGACMHSQVDVNGPGAAPVFDFLKNAKGGLLGNDVRMSMHRLCASFTSY
jgi:glutathione peroxidase-family protein